MSQSTNSLGGQNRAFGSSGVLRLRQRLVGWVSRHRHAAILGSLIFVLVAVATAWEFSTSGGVQYVTAPVGRGSISRSVTATGSINPILTIIVGSYVSGVIQDISCDFNTHVKKGQLCAKIDPRPYQTVVDQEKANLETARAQLVKDQANLAYTNASWQRYVNLFAQNATSRDALDVATNNYNQAKALVALDRASVDQHIAALAAAQVNLGYTDITSPVDGTVVSRNVTIGQTVAASFQTPTLFLIATELSNMEVDTNVSESDIGDVKAGDRATFSVDAFPDRAFPGQVSQVRQAPQTVQNVVTYDVVVAAPNQELLLKPGMTATVRIVTEERRSVMRVPNQALRYAPGGLAANAAQSASPQVWVLRNGKPERMSIATGLDDDSFTEVTRGGLRPGDQVILSERRANAPTTTRAPALRF